MKYLQHIILAFAALPVSASAFAWGSYEHTVIAYAAQFHLSVNAAENIRRYLDQPIYEYADWMDYVPMQSFPEYEAIGRNAHMVAYGLDGRILGSSPFLNGQANCYGAMKDILDVLKNHNEEPFDKVVLYLRYLIHMMGDFHCPGHILYVDLPQDGSLLPDSEWRGNRIWKKCWYKGSRQTIHWLWDTALQHEHGDWNYQQWTDCLDVWDEDEIAHAVEGTLEDWVRDNASRCSSLFSYSRENGLYDESYYGPEAIELSHRQIRLAIYRLAKVLNDCFDYVE